MITPHTIAWTPESIGRFWNNYESTPGMDLWHFSRQRGAALLDYVETQTDIVEPVLDLGCGSGHLLNLLLRRQKQCFGADIQSKGIEIVIDRFGAHPCFLGAKRMESGEKIPLDAQSVGTVFLLETIEHLLPQALDALFSDISRVLKKGGQLIITAPWRENLDESLLRCDGCGGEFHPIQHIRSCDEKTVTSIVAKASFSILSCRPALLLPDFKVWLQAQAVPARLAIPCPECARPCLNPRQPFFKRCRSLVRELKHLVCIASQ